MKNFKVILLGGEILNQKADGYGYIAHLQTVICEFTINNIASRKSVVVASVPVQNLLAITEEGQLTAD